MDLEKAKARMEELRERERQARRERDDYERDICRAWEGEQGLVDDTGTPAAKIRIEVRKNGKRVTEVAVYAGVQRDYLGGDTAFSFAADSILRGGTPGIKVYRIKKNGDLYSEAQNVYGDWERVYG